MRAVALIATVAVAGVISATALPGSTMATPIPMDGAASCHAAAGVMVVVDFQELDTAPPRVVCVEQWAGGTALAAIEAAGFTVTGTTAWGKAFVCRINGLPSAADDSCADTPPASAHWEYWQWVDGHWQPASTGVAGTRAATGTWHAMSFSLNRSAANIPPPRLDPAQHTTSPATPGEAAPSTGTSVEPTAAPPVAVALAAAVIVAIALLAAVRARGRRRP